MPITIWIAALAVVGGIIVLVWTLATPSSASEEAARRNLGVPSNDLRTARLGAPVLDRTVRPTLERISGATHGLLPVERFDRADHLIARAGMTGRWSPEQHIGVKFVLGGVTALLGAVRFLASPDLTTFVVVALLVVVAYIVPDLFLRERASKRQQLLVRELPDVLDQVTISVEAGLGFEAALQRVVQTTPGALSEEFGRMLQDVQIGTRRTEALEHMVERTEVDDLRHVATALVQSDRHGVPLAQTLRTLAKEMRSKRRMRAEESANKIAVKLLFPVVFCLFPALFVVILGPAMIRIADNF